MFNSFHCLLMPTHTTAAGGEVQSCLQWREAACLFGFLSFDFLFSPPPPHPPINIKRERTTAWWNWQDKKSTSMVKIMLKSPAWEFHVYELYWLNRQEAILFSPQHLHQEQKVSTPCHLKGNVAFRGRFFFLINRHQHTHTHKCVNA